MAAGIWAPEPGLSKCVSAVIASAGVCPGLPAGPPAPGLPGGSQRMPVGGVRWKWAQGGKVETSPREVLWALLPEPRE